MKPWTPALFALTLMVGGTAPAFAMEANAPAAGAAQGNPALRQARQARRQAMQNLTPEQKAAFEKARAARRAAWQAMTPEQKAAAKAQMQARRQGRQARRQGNAPTR